MGLNLKHSNGRWPALPKNAILPLQLQHHRNKNFRLLAGKPARWIARPLEITKHPRTQGSLGTLKRSILPPKIGAAAALFRSPKSAFFWTPWTQWFSSLCSSIKRSSSRNYLQHLAKLKTGLPGGLNGCSAASAASQAPGKGGENAPSEAVSTSPSRPKSPNDTFRSCSSRWSGCWANGYPQNLQQILKQLFEVV